jgi:hypothetical protein
VNPEVAAYVAGGKPWQQAALQQLHDAVSTALPDATVAIQYGKPHFALDGDLVAALHLAGDKVSLLLLGAGAIPAEKGFTRAMGDGSRKVVDVLEGDTVDTERIVRTIRAIHAG